MQRRRFLGTVGGAAFAGAAGCLRLTEDGDGNENGDSSGGGDVPDDEYPHDSVTVTDVARGTHAAGGFEFGRSSPGKIRTSVVSPRS